MAHVRKKQPVVRAGSVEPSTVTGQRSPRKGRGRPEVERWEHLRYDACMALKHGAGSGEGRGDERLPPSSVAGDGTGRKRP